MSEFLFSLMSTIQNHVLEIFVVMKCSKGIKVMCIPSLVTYLWFIIIPICEWKFLDLKITMDPCVARTRRTLIHET